MKYCSSCGGPVAVSIPEGDNRERHICQQCDRIHYQNPRIVAGCLVIKDDKVLLCRRAIHPRKGFWTLPAGFMENSETTQEAAIRETWEEALARVDKLELYTLSSITHVSQVQMIYRCQLVGEDFAAGEETLETRLFSEAEIPWDELAFDTIHNALQFYFADRKTGNYPLRHVDL